MAPEYAMQGIYSIKSDVYSFGVLVLQIVSGRKNNSFQNEEGPLNLVEYASGLWSNDAAIEVMDPMLKSSCSCIDQLKRCIHVGLLCLENRATDRPTIEDVISMLKNEMMLLPMPNCPAFVTRDSTVYELENGNSESFRDTVKPGDSLSSSDSLVSANNVFTLGFSNVFENNYYHSYLATSFTDSSSYNPVWLGNREEPITDGSGILTISSAGKLILTSNISDPISGGNGTNITATLLNSGNFVVRETNINGSTGRILWESFDYPTDTLLPGIKLGVNHRTGRNWHLTSWFENFNPASGAFTLEWDPSTRKLIVQRRGLIYWTSGDLKDYTNQILRLTVKEFENIPKPDFVDFNYNFTNVSNGVEDYFSYSPIIDPKSTPEDRKTISGWQLKYNGDIYNRDRAMIAEVSHCYGYNIEGSSVYEGCEPSCRNHNETFVLKSGRFANGNGSEAIADFDDDYNLTESDCRGKCWNDCECLGFVGRDGYGCFIGRYDFRCLYWQGKNFTFVQSFDGSAPKQFVLVSESSNKRKRKKEELHELMTLEEYTETHPVESDRGQGHHLTLFTYSSILRATGSFSLTNKLGEGGFGPVYKGKTVEGREIAVKVLSRMSVQGLLEFKIELILISKIQHVNLVKVLGFCVHGDEKMIIYDYMPNKSLDFFLFCPTKRELLIWDTRFTIIEGIAQGLLYLHKYSRLRIIHRDLKASNILLDEEMNPKISDFGMAKIFKQNVIEANTNKCAGTYGYMAPEYAMQGTYSMKSDVYSFGVLVLEIVSGRKNNSFRNEEGPLNLVEYAWELWSNDDVIDVIDPMLKSSCSPTHQLKRCIHVGLLCLENCATDRPTIEDVISMLKNDMMLLPMPKCPAFVTRNSTVYELENGRAEKFSANGLSMSAIDGR
ncbi:G-type lectin S-receptor-like serine threonine-kinase CES101 isoform X5 [Olea europaea subsp. europaea]|uniref:non-specific serine/threonine protein kinase n=1 Tax=Olea europaea subsp. europaea TaxID=158383 RepID=A0A8S0RZ60_OLEEU|nr:G-type lectin S-receptor-like serine threonine-kinase CES101 isoform X5 [Olea europaea subsp. europaea]